MIKQRWFINSVLLISIGFLSLIVFFTQNSEQNPAELPPLTNSSPEQVQQIRIERLEKEPIEFTKKQEGRWFMTKPLDLPANTFRVQQLLELLTTRHYQEVTSLPLTDLNLDVPLAKVHIDSLTFAFGASPVLDNTQRYVQLAQKTYLIENNLYPFLVGDPLTFASLYPLGENSKMTAMQLPNYQFSLLADGAWDITTTLENIDKRPDTVNRFIENWQNLQAFEVQNYVENTSEGEITITLSEQSFTFHIVNQPPNFILARPDKGIQYLFSIQQADKLLHLPTKEESIP